MPLDSSSCVADAFHAVSLGAARRSGGLVQFPLLNPVSRPPAWLTAQDALEQFALEARELLEAPTVSELRAVNHFDLPVLLLCGDLLVGAKSNRVVNCTLLALPRSSLNIPVSCVEAGRWGGSHHVRRAGACAPPRIRSAIMSGVSRQLEEAERTRPELSPVAARMADQKEIWREVAILLKSLPEASSTLDLASAYASRTARLGELATAHRSVGYQVGSVFASPSRGVLGLELCSDPATYNRLLPRLVQGYGLELAAPAPLAPLQRVTEDEAQAFLRSVVDASARSLPALGIGEEIRLAGPGVTGAGVFLEGEVIHLSAFPVR